MLETQDLKCGTSNTWSAGNPRFKVRDTQTLNHKPNTQGAGHLILKLRDTKYSRCGIPNTQCAGSPIFKVRDAQYSRCGTPNNQGVGHPIIKVRDTGTPETQGVGHTIHPGWKFIRAVSSSPTQITGIIFSGKLKNVLHKYRYFQFLCLDVYKKSFENG